MQDLLAVNVRAAGQRLQQAWLTYLDNTSTSMDAKEREEQALREAFPQWGEYALGDWKLDPKETEVHADLARCLVEILTRELRRVGHAPDIDRDEADELAYGDIQSFREFSDSYEGDHRRSLEAYARFRIGQARTRDFAAMAERLLARYTPEKAKSAALQQAIQRIESAFETRYGQGVEIKERSGAKVLQTPLYCSYSNEWNANFDTRARIVRLVDDFADLLAEAKNEDVHTSADLRRFGHDGHYTSRMAIQCGRALKLVFFKGRVEFQFEAAAMNAVQIAIAGVRQSAATH